MKTRDLNTIMKNVILVLVILLLIIGIIPIHEFGHLVVAKSVGGEIKDVYWLSFSSIPGEKGEHCYGGLVDTENIPPNWKLAVTVLGGGMLQGLLYVMVGFTLSFRKEKTIKVTSVTLLILGIIGIMMGLHELWEANHQIYFLGPK